MEDKINIYVSNEIFAVLENDMSSFGFRKPSGEINKNDFINTLLNNYLEIYFNNQKTLEDKISAIFKKCSLHFNKIKQDEFVSSVLEVMPQNNISDSSYQITLSFKPTRKLSNNARYILDTVYNLSGYLRNVLESYINLPQNKREQIIFINIYNEVKEAVEERKILKVKHKKNTDLKEINPYDIATGKEEMFNYIIGEDQDGNPISFRLGNLIYAYKTERPASFKDISLERFKDAAKYGPQFVSSDIVSVCVKLTDEGIKHFNRAYVHRPRPTKIDGHLYYFNWNYDQIFYYFTRLGKDATIISPESMKKDMVAFLKESLKNYE